MEGQLKDVGIIRMHAIEKFNQDLLKHQIISSLKIHKFLYWWQNSCKHSIIACTCYGWWKYLNISQFRYLFSEDFQWKCFNPYYLKDWMGHQAFVFGIPNGVLPQCKWALQIFIKLTKQNKFCLSAISKKFKYFCLISVCWISNEVVWWSRGRYGHILQHSFAL